MALLWTLLYGEVALALASALLLGAGPKRWVVWSDVAAKVYRHRTAPPWNVLTRLGKLATVIFYTSTLLAICTLMVGIWLERR